MSGVPETLAIVGATIIDGNGGAPTRDGVIVMDGARIVEVGGPSTQIPPRAKRIAATGKFVVPGLMTAHVFLADGTSPSTLILHERQFDEVAIEAAQLALKGGLTTVFDVWGPRDSLIMARDAIRQGRVTASRIYLAGNIVGYDGPLSSDFRPGSRQLVSEPFAARIDSQWQLNVGQALIRMAPEEVRAEIREYAQSGIDFLNYAVTDHRENAFQYIVFSPRVQQVIVEEAHRAGLPVMGFFPATNESIVLALSAGVDLTMVSDFSAPDVSSEVAALLVKRQVPCGLLLNTPGVLKWYDERSKIDSFLKAVEGSNVVHRRLLDAGVVPLLIAAGGVRSEDSLASIAVRQATPPVDGFCSLGSSHFYRLLAMQENGMEPMAILMAATRNIARAYKIDKDLGTLERGKLADLLILDKNPLDDADNYRTINLIIKDGEVVDRDKLPTRRLITVDRKSEV